MKIEICLILIVFIFSFNFVQAQEYDDLTNYETKVISEKKITDEELLRILISISIQGDPWVQRKEIAAWAATVLFLTIIGLISSNYKKYRKSKILSVGALLFGLTLLWLFSHFINEQYGSVANDIARRSIYIFELVKLSDAKDKVPFPFEDVLNVEGADTTQSHILYKKLIKRIRSRGLLHKLVLPLQHIIYRFEAWYKNESWREKSAFYWSENKGYYQPSTVEIEEAIQYNIMILAFLSYSFFIFYLSIWKSTKDFFIKIYKSLQEF